MPVPRATCGPGSRPETDIQGRVPLADHRSGRAAEGYTCNTEMVGSFRPDPSTYTVGGFKVERYVDAAGHECAFYDSTQLFPTSAPTDKGPGVFVLDMSDPAHPVRTATLVTPAMLSPHESLVLSRERGLLAAVLGNPALGPGVLDVYDVAADCRHPVHLSTTPMGVFGHESGFAPDGRTFYSASAGSQTIVAVGLDDPRVPVPLWTGPIGSHGLSISDDGNRAYVAALEAPDVLSPYLPIPSTDADRPGMLILDTSEIQAREPNPQVRVLSFVTWSTVSIPQNAIPITVEGRPYVLEVDEFGEQAQVGAARLIDVADESRPVVVSNLRLEVHQKESFERQRDDPGENRDVAGYSAHYCNVPRRDDPTIAACGMIASGLRVFDIRDPHRPREVAYFNAPVVGGPDLSNLAMSSPAFVPERSEIWYTDANSGFYVVRLTNGVWPGAGAVAPTPSPAPAPAPAADDVLPTTGWGAPVLGGLAAVLAALGLHRLRHD